ncbi:RNA-directed DNA polymerase, eukaryota, reverse transcriptase zinc-binding domain protein [Tanacetum coccineum]
MVKEESAQVIHCFVEPLIGDKKFHCSFIYAHVHTIKRRSLWRSLQKYKRSIQDDPWIILGDFNATLDPFEKSTGGSKTTTARGDFRDCVLDIDIKDISMSGLRFTWNKKLGKKRCLLKKLDMVMGNVEFMSAFPSAFAQFMPFMTSDHTSTVLVILGVKGCKAKPFKFHNFLSNKYGFLPMVKSVFKNELASIQSVVVADLPSDVLREAELKCFNAYNVALRDEESFLKPKAKTEWLKEGDKNSNVLGRSSNVCPIEDHEALFHKKISPSNAAYMAVIGEDLCKDVMEFFEFWQTLLRIIDLMRQKKQLWRDLQSELLIERYKFLKSAAEKLKLCCSSWMVLHDIRYYCWLVLRTVLMVDSNTFGQEIVNIFVSGEAYDKLFNHLDMLHASLEVKELIRGYHSSKGVARCAFKVDIQKAYDTIEWKFLESCLSNFGFHRTMLRWIMECVTSTFFSINVKWNLLGFFKGKRGVRQGDPLSPYLFTLVMEILNLLIKKHISLNLNFKTNWQCKDLNITHLCFTDDLMLFCQGDSFCVYVLNKALDEFGNVSGLLPSISKSTVFFGNAMHVTKARILKIMPFKVGNLLVRYLGVPLISKRLQLINFVVGSMPIYWYSMFILPDSIANEVERLMRDFLWNFGQFLDIPDKEGSSWIWRRILNVRGLLRNHIVSKIGDGKGTSLWFDNWHPICPLNNFISKRKIHYSGLSLKTKVADVIDRGKWKWPKVLCDEFNGLLCIDPPVIFEDKIDKIMWRTNSGGHKNFNVSAVWYDLR